MPGGTGSSDKSGCPTVIIEVIGGVPGSGRSITALVDTGFSGFLSLPILEAFPIGLILHGTTSVILADGSRHSKFTCLGTISFGGDSHVGVIIIEPVGTEALIGIEFLKKFNLALVADPASNMVSLYSSDFIQQAIAAAQSQKPKAS